MDNEKNFDFDEGSGTREGEFTNESSTRARNRTVMLTPEITGQVRARLQQDMDAGPPPVSRAMDHAPAHEPPMSSTPAGGGFYSPMSRAAPTSQPQIAAPAAPVMAQPERVEYRAPQQQAAPAPTTDGAIWVNEGPVMGFLVSYDSNRNGDVCTLRSGRLIVTSAPQSNGNYLLINDETVSPLHAIMRVSQGGEIQILDQLSEFGTIIRRFGSDEEVELSGEKSTLEHGDVVRFGNRSFHVCVIARGEGTE